MMRLPMANHPMAPLAALGVAIFAAGLAFWPRPVPPWNSAEATEPRQVTPKYASYEATAHPAAYRPARESRPEMPNCISWDVSPIAMEAILQEMVRQGWRPPRSDVALASTQPDYRSPIEALSPDQPVRVASPRGSTPVENGEIVDVTIESGAHTPEASTPELAPAPSVATPSASMPEPVSPEAPSSSN